MEIGAEPADHLVMADESAVNISVATVMTDVFQKNGIMVSIKLLKP